MKDIIPKYEYDGDCCKIHMNYNLVQRNGDETGKRIDQAQQFVHWMDNEQGKWQGTTEQPLFWTTSRIYLPSLGVHMDWELAHDGCKMEKLENFLSFFQTEHAAVFLLTPGEQLPFAYFADVYTHTVSDRTKVPLWNFLPELEALFQEINSTTIISKSKYFPTVFQSLAFCTDCTDMLSKFPCFPTCLNYCRLSGLRSSNWKLSLSVTHKSCSLRYVC